MQYGNLFFKNIFLWSDGEYNLPKKLQPILEDIVRDPSAFGGPDTYRNIVEI